MRIVKARWERSIIHASRTGTRATRETVTCCACKKSVRWVESWVTIAEDGPSYLHCATCAAINDPTTAWLAQIAKVPKPKPQPRSSIEVDPHKRRPKR